MTHTVNIVKENEFEVSKNESQWWYMSVFNNLGTRAAQGRAVNRQLSIMGLWAVQPTKENFSRYQCY